MELARVIMSGLIVLAGIVSITLVTLSLLWSKWFNDIYKDMKDDEFK